MVGLYASSMPAEQLERNGVNPKDLQPGIDALGKGDLAGAIELTPLEIAEQLSVAGTPEECVAKLRSEVVDAGVNHLIFAITDAVLVKALMSRDLENVASVNDQLQLIHDEVMPAFA
jgi:5,10-methylenetetrahydromethanopterin reductase